MLVTRLAFAMFVLSGLAAIAAQQAGVALPTGVLEPAATASGYGLALFIFTVYRSEKRDTEARYAALAAQGLTALEQSIATTTAVRAALEKADQFDRIEGLLRKMGGHDERG